MKITTNVILTVFVLIILTFANAKYLRIGYLCLGLCFCWISAVLFQDDVYVAVRECFYKVGIYCVANTLILFVYYLKNIGTAKSFGFSIYISVCFVICISFEIILITSITYVSIKIKNKYKKSLSISRRENNER